MEGSEVIDFVKVGTRSTRREEQEIPWLGRFWVLSVLEQVAKNKTGNQAGDSRFSAISSIFVTLFQLRPVEGVCKAFWMAGKESLVLPIPLGK